MRTGRLAAIHTKYVSHVCGGGGSLGGGGAHPTVEPRGVAGLAIDEPRGVAVRDTVDARGVAGLATVDQ